jgi:SAM-dependent methyltransferase
MKKSTFIGSIIGNEYSSGEYFRNEGRHAADAKFKVADLAKVLFPNIKQYNLQLSSLVDVGCGSGEATRILVEAFKKNGLTLISIKGYDVSPHIKNVHADGIEFIWGDFCESTEFADLVTLFDVFEHVPDPINFIKGVAERCNVMAFRIPLDNCLYNSLRNCFRSGLINPGHLLILDLAAALNILALSGVRVIDYRISTCFKAPSNRSTVLAQAAVPLLTASARISPWLVSRIFGSSVSVVALTPRGMQKGI